MPKSADMHRKLIGLIVGCIGTFIYLFSLNFLEYIQQVQKYKYVDFDVKTITAADYSVEFEISEKQYAHWKKYYNQEDNPMSEMAQFKVYIQDIIEQRINEMSDLGYNDQDSVENTEQARKSGAGQGMLMDRD